MLPPLLFIALQQGTADNRFRVRLSFPLSTTTKFRAELPFGVMLAVPVQSVAPSKNP